MIEPVNSKYFKLSVGKLKKDSTDEISCCCPACDDTKNRLHLYHTEVGDLVHCFNSGCELEGKHHTVLNFLKIINSMYISAYKRSTLSNTIEDIKNTSNLSDILNRVKEKEVESEVQADIPLQKIFGKCTDSEECLEYLTTRHILPRPDWFFSTQKFFKYQEKNVYLMDYLLIPIYNKEMKYRGFYSRSIKEKTFSTFLLDDTEKVWLNHPNEQPEIICEGIFDALSTDFELSGAMLGADLSPEFRDSLSKNTIFAFDNDETGTKKAIKYAQQGFSVYVWPEMKEKDFNELLQIGYSTSDVKRLITSNIYRGIMAETRLRMKEI